MNDIGYITYCIICGHNKFTYMPNETALIRSAVGGFVVRCEGCGFKFLNPQVQKIYDREYFDEFKEKSHICGGSYILEDFLKERLNEAEKFIQCGRLLEIGFAEGLFLEYASKRGWDIYGVDISNWAVETTKKRFGFKNLYAGRLVDVNFDNSFFDVIHMNHVLEHIPDIIDFLEELRRILKPEGLLIVEVPNEINSLQERMRDMIGIKRKQYEVPSPHLWFFTPRTIKRLFINCHFSLSRAKTLRRNKETSSRYIGGTLFKRVIYFLEDIFQKGPIIELWVTKEAKGNKQ